MTDHLFAPALLLFGVFVGSFLGLVELLWIKWRSPLAGAWSGLVVVALANVAFIYLLIVIQGLVRFPIN